MICRNAQRQRDCNHVLLDEFARATGEAPAQYRINIPDAMSK
jgi:hypothetical protein